MSDEKKPAQKRFRKKPVVIEAVQITAEWFDGEHPNDLHPLGLVIDPVTRRVEIGTLEGTMYGSEGDWIITGVKGERYPCKPDIFEATYESVGEPAQARLTREAIERLKQNI
jgi:hypothetical protein